jgi:hypothetical protein
MIYGTTLLGGTVQVVSASTQLNPGDRYIAFNGAAGLTLTLPVPSVVGEEHRFTVFGANTVTVASAGGLLNQKFHGAAPSSSNVIGTNAWVFWDGTFWQWILGA